jgi:hypothetical protein
VFTGFQREVKVRPQAVFQKISTPAQAPGSIFVKNLDSSKACARNCAKQETTDATDIDLTDWIICF